MSVDARGDGFADAIVSYGPVTHPSTAPRSASAPATGTSRRRWPSIDLPFKGGTLVPALTLITSAMPLDAEGERPERDDPLSAA